MNRKQHVVHNGQTSLPCDITLGVPRGSILGPLLFSIFINDLFKVTLTPGTKLILYTDDIALYKHLTSSISLPDLQKDIHSVSSWINENDLLINLKKTKILVISRLKTLIVPHLEVDGHRSPR